MLLTLPSLVIDKVLDFLDVKSLLQLRCVCKGTRDIVHEPYHMRRLKVIILKNRRLKAILKSSSPWKNFKIDWKHSVRPEDMKYRDILSRRLLNEFHDIRCFEDTGQSCDFLHFESLFSHTNLEYLSVCASGKKFLTAVRNLNVSLISLQTLELYRSTQEELCLILSIMLPKVPNLRRLKLKELFGPRFSEDNHSVSTPDLFECLRNCIENHKAVVKNSGTVSLTIDFNAVHEHTSSFWDEFYHYINCLPTPKETPTLDFYRVCCDRGVVLKNLCSHYLPRYSHKYISPLEAKNAFKCVKNLHIVGDSEDLLLPPGPHYSLWVEIKSQDLVSYHVPGDIISDLTIAMDCWAPMFHHVDENGRADLFARLFCHRETLRKLRIKRDTYSSFSVYVEIMENALFSSNPVLPNLRVLEYDFIEKSNSIRNLFKNCPNLEVLVLSGEISNELFCQLDCSHEEECTCWVSFSSLKELTLVPYGTQILSDVLFNVLSKLKLKKLSIRSRYMAPQLNISMKGVETLVAGDCRNSIEVLNVDVIPDRGVRTCEKLIKKSCPKIKFIKFFRYENMFAKTSVKCKFIYKENGVVVHGP